MELIQECEYSLKLNEHSEALLAWRYGVLGDTDGESQLVTGFFKRVIEERAGRLICLFSIPGCSRARLIVDGGEVITALPREKSFDTTDANLAASLIEGVRLADPALLPAKTIIRLRNEILKRNEPINKDSFRRHLRKILNSARTAKIEDVKGPGEAANDVPEERNVRSGSLFERAEEILERLKSGDQFVQTKEGEFGAMPPEELEEIAVMGIPEKSRHVGFWDEHKNLEILAVDAARIVGKGLVTDLTPADIIEGKPIFNLFYEVDGTLYRLFTKFKEGIWNYPVGTSGIFVKNYGAGGLYIEDPKLHEDGGDIAD